MNKKYELTDEIIEIDSGVKLHRIRSLRSFGNSQVYGNSKVFERSQVYGNANIFGNAHIFG